MGKGGGGGSTPRLLDDNLKNKQFLNVIDLVSEGPIEGPVGGMSGFLLNGTPVVDEDGNPNIHGVEVQWRSGTQTQEPLEDFPFVEKEIPVNVEVKKAHQFYALFQIRKLTALDSLWVFLLLLVKMTREISTMLR